MAGREELVVDPSVDSAQRRIAPCLELARRVLFAEELLLFRKCEGRGHCHTALRIPARPRLSRRKEVENAARRIRPLLRRA